MMEHLVAVFAVVSGILLLIVLTFLYKLTVAIGRLEGRLERLIILLRDADLSEIPQKPDAAFGFETEIQHADEDWTDMGTDPVASYTPAPAADSSPSTTATAIAAQPIVTPSRKSKLTSDSDAE